MTRLYYYSKLSQSTRIAQLLTSEQPDDSGFTGKLYPSGKLSVGRVPRRRVLRGDVDYERNRTHYTCYKKSHWDYEQGLVHEYCQVPSGDSVLGLASVENCHKSAGRRYGLRGISVGGRTSVREGAYILERRYGRRMGFYTLTCPYTDEQSIYSYNKNIAYIQKTYFQELKREYERQGCCWSYVSVLEIQSERFDNSGVPCLHIHYVAPCYLPGTTAWICEADTLRRIWGRVLFNCLGGKPIVSASIDASVIRKSAVGYISKYMSKGSSEVSFLAEICPEQLPGQWWSWSSNVRKCVKKATVILPCSQASIFFYGTQNDPSSPFHLYYSRSVYAFIHGEEKKVGVSGNMKPDNVYLFQDWSTYWNEFNDL